MTVLRLVVSLLGIGFGFLVALLAILGMMPFELGLATLALIPIVVFILATREAR